MSKSVAADLLSVNEARQRMQSVFSPGDIEKITISDALSRILAHDVRANTDWPPFDNSSMDGFAVQVRDVVTASPDHPVVLSVVADIPAGKEINMKLNPGQAIRIMTGAAVPPGAEAVVPIEETDHSFKHTGASIPDQVKIFKPVEFGAYIRPRGQDLLLNQVVMQSGHRIHPQEMGMLAALGNIEVDVYKVPRIAILSTGDELIDPGQPLSPGKIRDSNSLTLAGLIHTYGGAPVQMGIVPDQFDMIRDQLDKAVDLGVDLILTSAGVSVGVYDYVRDVVTSNGHLDFWRVNMRPGKPVAFGDYRGTPLVGLPGNPVSAYVAFLVFVRPVLQKLSGAAQDHRTLVKVNLEEPIESDGRESYLRGIVSFQGREITARLTGHQGSGNILSLIQANALLIIPSGIKSLPAGSEVDAWLLEI